MGRCIAVLSVPRAGSSCLAGMLHSMGIDMGSGHLQDGNEFNEKGYYEDLRWQRIDKMITGPRYNLNDHPAEQILDSYLDLARKCNTKKLWGMKDPRLAITVRYIAPLLEDLRIIRIERSFEASVSSLVRHSERNYGGKYRLNTKQAMQIITHWDSEVLRSIAMVKVPTASVEYGNIVANPQKAAREIADFCTAGLHVDVDAVAGARFVEKRLVHYGV